MSFQIFSIDSSEYLIKVLPLFRGGKSYTSNELADLFNSLDLSVHPRRCRHLLQIWYVLGFLNRDRVGNAYNYELSDFGKGLLKKLQFNQPLAVELAHWAWYSAWLRSPEFEIAWSWLYQDICNLLWEASPNVINAKQLTAIAVENAALLYPNQNQALDNASIGAILSWLATMDPPFLIKEDRESSRSSLVSQKRDSCNPELMYLSIQLQYYIKGITFGTPLLIEEQIINAICKTCLLRLEQFWPMVELCSITFNSLVRKETAYGTSLSIDAAAPFTPPYPRQT